MSQGLSFTRIGFRGVSVVFEKWQLPGALLTRAREKAAPSMLLAVIVYTMTTLVAAEVAPCNNDRPRLTLVLPLALMVLISVPVVVTLETLSSLVLLLLTIV